MYALIFQTVNFTFKNLQKQDEEGKNYMNVQKWNVMADDTLTGIIHHCFKPFFACVLCKDSSINKKRHCPVHGYYFSS